MEFQYDHCNIESLRFLFANYSRKAIEVMKSLTIAEQDIPRFPGYYTWAIFRNVEDLDLHGCKLESLPSLTLVKALPMLTKLNLSRNALTTVSDVVPFGTLRSLSELNLKENPIPFVDHRIKLIQSLLFPLSLVRFKISKYAAGEYHRSSASATSTPLKKRTKSYTGIRQFLGLRRKPAKVPRVGHFPMLSVVNEQQITEDEVSSAKPYNDEDVVPVAATHVRTSTWTPLILRGQRNKPSSYTCFVRKARVESVPRLEKVQEFVGEAELSRSLSKLRPEPVDPKDRHRLHKANHRENDLGVSLKRKLLRKPNRLKPKRFRLPSPTRLRMLPQNEASDVSPRSFAGEEDTLRKSSSSEKISELEEEAASPERKPTDIKKTLHTRFSSTYGQY